MITPFSQNLEVDYDCLGNHIDFLISEGSHGLVSCGTTGESPTLNHDEHKAVTEFIIKRSKEEFQLWQVVDQILLKNLLIL